MASNVSPSHLNMRARIRCENSLSFVTPAKAQGHRVLGWTLRFLVSCNALINHSRYLLERCSFLVGRASTHPIVLRTAYG